MLAGLAAGAFLAGGVTIGVGSAAGDTAAVAGAELPVPTAAAASPRAASPPVVTTTLPVAPTASPLPTVEPARPTTAAPTTETRAVAAATTTAAARPTAAPPTTTSTTTPPPPVTGGPIAQVAALTNAARETAGCAPLRIDARLNAAADGHAEDMSAKSYFSHDGADGRTFDARITDAGYPAPGGENIARGQTSATQVVGDWMASAGHRRNILDCSFETIGVGFAGEGNYWVQNFGR